VRAAIAGPLATFPRLHTARAPQRPLSLRMLRVRASTLQSPCHPICLAIHRRLRGTGNFLAHPPSQRISRSSARPFITPPWLEHLHSGC